MASSLVELACEQARQAGADRVLGVHVRIGVLQHVARSLYFCFHTVARGTVCEGAQLEVEQVDLAVLCHHCGEVKRPRGRYDFRCPDCGAATPEVVAGRELQFRGITVGPAPSAAGPAPHEQRPASVAPANG